jgi:hypothetical protein
MMSMIQTDHLDGALISIAHNLLMVTRIHVAGHLYVFLLLLVLLLLVPRPLLPSMSFSSTHIQKQKKKSIYQFIQG